MRCVDDSTATKESRTLTSRRRAGTWVPQISAEIRSISPANLGTCKPITSLGLLLCTPERRPAQRGGHSPPLICPCPVPVLPRCDRQDGVSGRAMPPWNNPVQVHGWGWASTLRISISRGERGKESWQASSRILIITALARSFGRRQVADGWGTALLVLTRQHAPSPRLPRLHAVPDRAVISSTRASYNGTSLSGQI